MKSDMNEKHHHVKQHQRLRFNVSGRMYETYEATLQRYPNTLLGCRLRRHIYFNEKLNQYFFNRNFHAFEAILFFYQSDGKLSRPFNVSIDCFEQECDFFCIPIFAMSAMRTNEGRELVHSLKNMSLDPKYGNDTLRLKIWNLLDNPYSSSFAMKIIIFQISTIVLSVIVNSIETLPDAPYKNRSPHIKDNPWLIMEFTLSAWFFTEFMLRTACTPDWRKFVSSGLNWIDLFGIPPYLYINYQTDNRYIELLQVFRFFRALRVFRLVKCSKRLKAIMVIFQDSLKDLQLFFVCLFIIVVFGSSVVYFLEKDIPGTSFISVPDSMWWGVQTFLTLGYGDIAPTTLLGKLFASVFMVFGVTTMSLPVLALIMKFSAYSKVV